MVKKIEKPKEGHEEERKQQVKEKRKNCLKKISERKTSLSTPRPRPYSPKISTPDNVTNKGGGGFKLKESNVMKINLINKY